MLKGKIWNSRALGDTPGRAEKWLGYFAGPSGPMLLTSLLVGYMNVYFTDVAGLSVIAGGLFLGLFPIICKFIEAFMFVVIGRAVDRTTSPQGKARPWVLLAAPAMLAGVVLLFTVPAGGDWLKAVWVVVGYLLFYAIGNTAHATGAALLVPLSTSDRGARSSLSLLSNSVGMVTGTLVAVVFPSVVLPAIGVSRGGWAAVMLTSAAISLPLFLLEYFFTRERVTEAARASGSVESAKPVSLLSQLKKCVKSKKWIILMVYVFVWSFANSVSNGSTFYYCNWVLGSYNDGITQLLFYALGSCPLALGPFVCGPLCRKFGRRNAMLGGFILAVIGAAISLVAPRSIVVVLAGQMLKAIGLLPSAFMVSAMLADALDDVERVSGERCDGFSSSLYNIFNTITGGLALGLFNLLLASLGYLSPADASVLPIQSSTVQSFFIVCTLAVPVVSNAILGLLMWLSGDERKKNKNS